MSRIGKKPIEIPQGVTVNVVNRLVKISGPKGLMEIKVPFELKVVMEESAVVLTCAQISTQSKALWGTFRSLIANAVFGVSQGYKKNLELVGVGYRVAKQGNDLIINIGYSKPVEYKAISGISFEVVENTKIGVLGINKETVGQVAAEIRAIRKPEPYKGKGIRYEGEKVKRKAGKAGKVGA